MDLRIREFTGEGADLRAACGLWNAAVAMESTLYLEMTPALMTERLGGRTGRAADICLLAEQAGHPVGLAVACAPWPPASGAAYLAGLAVRPEVRGIGIGCALLAEVEERSREMGGSVLKLDYASPVRLAHGVDPATTGHHWLLRRGFRVSGNQLYMRLDLTGWDMPRDVLRLIDGLQREGVSLRVADPADLPGLLRAAGQVSDGLVDRFRDNAHGPKDPVLIALRQSDVVGFVGPLSVSPCGVPDFDFIAVLEPCRRRGIGKALFHLALQDFRRREGTTFELMTAPANPAQKLYLDAGLRIVTTLVCLEKHLAPAE